MAYATVSKTVDPKGSCGFDSLYKHNAGVLGRYARRFNWASGGICGVLGIKEKWYRGASTSASFVKFDSLPGPPDH